MMPVVPLQSQNGINHSARWIDSLQFYLRLDRPLISDSTFSITHLRKPVVFHINKERPDIYNSMRVIDSLVYHDNNDTTLARLLTLLHLFDARYLNEYAFRQDYFLDIYHKTPHEIKSNRKNELDLIEFLENAIILKRLSKKDPEFFVNVLIQIDTSYFSSKNVFESHTFKIFGRTNMSFIRRFYQTYDVIYEPFLIEAAHNQLTKRQAYSIIHTIGMFNKIPPDPADCEKLTRYVDKNTSKELLDVLSEYTQKWPGQECLKTLLNTDISD